MTGQNIATAEQNETAVYQTRMIAIQGGFGPLQQRAVSEMFGGS